VLARREVSAPPPEEAPAEKKPKAKRAKAKESP
jgi:hypothetical protein